MLRDEYANFPMVVTGFGNQSTQWIICKFQSAAFLIQVAGARTLITSLMRSLVQSKQSGLGLVSVQANFFLLQNKKPWDSTRIWLISKSKLSPELIRFKYNLVRGNFHFSFIFYGWSWIFCISGWRSYFLQGKCNLRNSRF